MRSLFTSVLIAMTLLQISARAAAVLEAQSDSLVTRDGINPCGTSTGGCSCIGTTCSYDFVGSAQQFIMPCKGSVSITAVGAGSNGNPNSGSKMAVSPISMGESGAAIIGQGDTFVIRVGQEGLAYPACSTTSSWNGGGKCATSKAASNAYGGGGATDVVYYGQNPITPAYATVLVAAGGAGGQSWNTATTSMIASQTANIGHVCSKAITATAKTKYATTGPLSCSGKGSGAGGGGGGYPGGAAGKISKSTVAGAFQGQSFVRGGSYEIPTQAMVAGVQISYTCSA